MTASNIRSPKCFICGSNEDYICEEHYDVLSAYTTTSCKITIEVIGDGTPRTFEDDGTSLPVINIHECVDEFINMLRTELDEDETQDFKFLLLITPEAVDTLTEVDIEKIFFINRVVSPIVLVFEDEASSKAFIEKYSAWNVKPGTQLPLLVQQQNWLTIFEFLRDDATIPNALVFYKVLMNADRSL